MEPIASNANVSYSYLQVAKRNLPPNNLPKPAPSNRPALMEVLKQQMTDSPEVQYNQTSSNRPNRQPRENKNSDSFTRVGPSKRNTHN